MDIADSSYKISGDTYVFSNDSIADFDDISDNDILSVVGIDKKILAISIKTGHGTLKLKNTELFVEAFYSLETVYLRNHIKYGDGSPWRESTHLLLQTTAGVERRTLRLKEGKRRW